MNNNMIKNENINLLAQDFFEAHVVEFSTESQTLPQLYTKMYNFLLTGKQDDLKPETINLLKGLKNYINYQMETRIQCVGIGKDPLISPTQT
jgi:hypothetical protein|tara:strand:- start:3404 stop:3679 length:276 start_codon:yes stop_codon:yes gene_type:complete